MSSRPYALPLENVIDMLVDVICVVRADTEIVYVSAASTRIFGYTPEEMIGRKMSEFMHPDHRERTLEHAQQVMEDAAPAYFENVYVRKDGSLVDLMWTARWSPGDGVRVAVARDITGRKRAESLQAALYAISEAAHTAADLLALFERIHGIIGGLLPARNFFVALHDAERDELSFPYFVDAHDATPAPRPLDSGTLSGEVIRTGQPLLLRSDDPQPAVASIAAIIGSEPLAWLGVPLTGQRGVIGALVVQSYTGDVRYSEADQQLLQFVSTQVAAAIERKQIEARLTHMARYDHLTDLPNRALFRDRLQNALARARRELERLAVLYLDLDRFKEINDQLGHAAGDLLLREVARRLGGCVRESDTVGRLGGDEFAVLLPRIVKPEDAMAVAEKIRRELHQVFELAGRPAMVSASVGIALYPDHGENEDDLLKLADDAMYATKRRGGNRVLMSSTPPPADA
ncbi:diguanylate cyclase domain-containing protein [Dyella sp.]|jgi:diguanylate cyclase (GGDEF)-like protein/PAS domain S-box-containing protein|uniref:diguanylate cyclase domain-containing protein n=1 Tax=Dyella sp. TaxID=1869338 RepID=UPI002D794E08|nr:diguanylate cyclase [Dyella sp.]HET6431327.1 diguanylate cyclase [Dyella sp.]